MACYHPIDCWRVFSSPFSGTFFQLLTTASACTTWRSPGFRPLSWGLFFNCAQAEIDALNAKMVFVPFLGDFFSIYGERRTLSQGGKFSSPFLGTFFQYRYANCGYYVDSTLFSSPFLGTFFQLSGGIASITMTIRMVFVPFLGDFFSIRARKVGTLWKIRKFSSPFLGTFFQ